MIEINFNSPLTSAPINFTLLCLKYFAFKIHSVVCFLQIVSSDDYVFNSIEDKWNY